MFRSTSPRIRTRPSSSCSIRTKYTDSEFLIRKDDSNQILFSPKFAANLTQRWSTSTQPQTGARICAKNTSYIPEPNVVIIGWGSHISEERRRKKEVGNNRADSELETIKERDVKEENAYMLTKIPLGDTFASALTSRTSTMIHKYNQPYSSPSSSSTDKKQHIWHLQTIGSFGSCSQVFDIMNNVSYNEDAFYNNDASFKDENDRPPRSISPLDQVSKAQKDVIIKKTPRRLPLSPMSHNTIYSSSTSESEGETIKKKETSVDSILGDRIELTKREPHLRKEIITGPHKRSVLIEGYLGSNEINKKTEKSVYLDEDKKKIDESSSISSLGKKSRGCSPIPMPSDYYTIARYLLKNNVKIENTEEWKQRLERLKRKS